ncbi:MAG: hypothetical protein L7U87_06835 [Chlamydiales bacterium]|nr:hypothetical protein [Chlamydiales bacterium]
MPLIISRLSLPSTKEVISTLTSPRSLKITFATSLALWALTGFVRLYLGRNSIEHLWGRVKLQGLNYKSFISQCETLKTKLRDIDCTKENPGDLYNVLAGMSDVEALASIETLVQEKREKRRTSPPTEDQAEEEVEGSVCTKNAMAAFNFLSEKGDAAIKKEAQDALRGHVSLLPKTPSRFLWSFNTSGLFQYLLWGSAMSTSLLTRVWSKSPPFLMLTSSLLKDYLPVTMRMGMESIYADYTIKRVAHRITPILRPLTSTLNEINQKYQTGFDAFHVVLFLFFMYRRYQEPPLIQTTLIPSNILSSNTVPYCESLNSRAHTGEYNQLELNESKLQELEDALSKGGGAILKGARGVGSSAFIKCFAQRVGLGELVKKQGYSIFSLNLDEIRPKENTLQSLLSPDVANSPKGKIEQMLSFITTKVNRPVIVLDNLHLYALSENLNEGSWFLTVLRQLATSLNQVDPSCRVKLLITSPPPENPASEKLANFLQEVFARQRSMTDLELRSANRTETAKVLHKLFGGITDDLLFLRPLDPSRDLIGAGSSSLHPSQRWWAKVYDWIKYCYPSAIMPGKAIEVIRDILDELQLKIDVKVQQDALQEGFGSDYKELKKAIKELRELERQSLESGYFLRSRLHEGSESGVFDFSATLLILEFILIPKKKHQIEALRVSLANEKYMLTEEHLKRYLQRKKGILLTLVSEPTCKDLKDIRDNKMPVEFLGKEGLINFLFSPYIDVLTSFDFINIRAAPGVPQEEYPLTYILQKRDTLLLPVVRDFSKRVLGAFGFRESLYEIDFSHYASWAEFIRLEGHQLFDVLHETPSTHIIIKNMKVLDGEDKQAFLAFMSGAPIKHDKELLPLKYATFYFVTDEDEIYTFLTREMSAVSITAFKDEAIDLETKKSYLKRNLKALRDQLFMSEFRIDFAYQDGVIDVLLAEAEKRNLPIAKYSSFLASFFRETCRKSAAGRELEENPLRLPNKKLFWDLNDRGDGIIVRMCDPGEV